MKLKNKSRIIVFIFSLIVWIALTDIKSYEEVLVGLVLAVLISLFAGHFLVTTEKSQHPIRRILYLLYLHIQVFLGDDKSKFRGGISCYSSVLAD